MAYDVSRAKTFFHNFLSCSNFYALNWPKASSTRCRGYVGYLLANWVPRQSLANQPLDLGWLAVEELAILSDNE